MARVEIESPPADRTAPATATKAKSRLRVRYNVAMRWMRRAHLYAGLYFVPWVFLYGVTAFLFNHPDAFPDAEIRSIDRDDLKGTPFADFPKPAVLAGRVVEAINGRLDEEGDEAGYKLVRPDEARLAREFSTTLTDGERQHLVRIDLGRGTGSVRSAPKAAPRERPAVAPFAVPGGVRLDPPPLAGVLAAVPTVLGRVGLPTQGLAPIPSGEGPPGGRGEGEGRSPAAEDRGGRGRRPVGEGERGDNDAAKEGGRGRRPGGEAEAARDVLAKEGGQPAPSRRADAPASKGQAPMAGRGPVAGGPGGAGRFAGPELSFLMEGQGKTWRVGYNLQTGDLTGRPDEDAAAGEPISFRRFLLRLHTAHGYPSDVNTRWIWAVAVDAMFVSMVGWGLTGLLMWWQMKNVRKLGAVVLVAGIVTALVSAMGMHSSMVGGP